MGAYQKGMDPVLDRAVAVVPAINAFLQQETGQTAPFDGTICQLMALPE
ncbi:MAG: hypothetical protein ACRD06_06980 [Terriglobia bacterium]